MPQPYYLPASLGDFYAWSANFSAMISATPTAYGLTAGDATAYALLVSDFETAYLISTAPGTRTPVTVADTFDKFVAARLKTQQLVQKAQASLLIDSVKAAELGITFRDTTKTVIAPPTAIPELAIEQITPLAVRLRVKELGALLNSLPLNTVGFQVAMSVAPVTPPMSPANLTIRGNGTKRFYDISFDGANIGDAYYVAVRYLNAKQQTGPWSNIITSTVVAG